MGKKISELDAITELDGTEQIPVEKGGANGKVSTENLLGVISSGIEALLGGIMNGADGNTAGLIAGATATDELTVNSVNDLNALNQLVMKEGAAHNRIVPLASGSDLSKIAYASALSNLDCSFFLHGNYKWGYKADGNDDTAQYAYKGVITFHGSLVTQFDADTHKTYRCYMPKGDGYGNEMEFMEVGGGYDAAADLSTKFINYNNSLTTQEALGRVKLRAGTLASAEDLYNACYYLYGAIETLYAFKDSEINPL